MRGKCLIICYTDLANDPRVLKHFLSLKDAYDVYTAGLSSIPDCAGFVRIKENSVFDVLELWVKAIPGKGFQKVFIRVINFFRFKLFSKLFFLRYWNVRRSYDLLKLRRLGKFDLVVANDLNTLPIASKLVRGDSKLVFDAHEYHPEEYAERTFWVKYTQPYILYLLRKYINGVDSCITVSPSIASRYHKEYHKSFEVILNAPPYQEVEPFLNSEGKVRLIYSGLVGSNRNIQTLIEALSYLPDHYELHFLVAGNIDESLKNMAAANHRLFFHPRVPLHAVCSFLNKFDIGVHLMPASNFNNAHALPNKYFQYIQGRLVTLFGPLKEVSRYTLEYGTGVICDGYSSEQLAKAVLSLSPQQILQYKHRNNENARILCEEKEILKLKEIYNKLIK